MNPTQPLSALPDRMIRRKFFDPERVVALLGWRPSLAALNEERIRRGGHPMPTGRPPRR
jgi:hypothetical protein